MLFECPFSLELSLKLTKLSIYQALFQAFSQTLSLDLSLAPLKAFSQALSQPLFQARIPKVPRSGLLGILSEQKPFKSLYCMLSEECKPKDLVNDPFQSGGTWISDTNLLYLDSFCNMTKISTKFKY